MRRAGIQQQASTPRPNYTGDIMFTNIHHVSYLVPNLDDAVASYSNAFGAELTGRPRRQPREVASELGAVRSGVHPPSMTLVKRERGGKLRNPSCLRCRNTLEPLVAETPSRA